MTSFDAPALRFTCSECGDCCRSGQVLLSEAERARLQSLDWSGLEPDLVGAETTAVVTDGPFRGHHRLARRPDGSCAYLGARNECRIHEHFGRDVKPLTCRSYPFSFRAMGDVVAVDVAFSCRAVSEERGEPVERLQGEWSLLLAEGVAGSAPPLHVARKQEEAPPELVLEIERVLLRLLQDASLEPPDRVRACADFLRLGLTGDPSAPTAALLRNAIAAGLPQRVRREPHPNGMDPTQRTVFRQWLYLALNPARPELRDLPSAERDRMNAQWRDAGLAFRDGRGHPFVAWAPLRTTFDAVESMDAALLRTSELPMRFLAAKLVGQRFLRSGAGELPLVDAARLLLLTFPMIGWTAKAFAADRGAPAVEDEDVRVAIRTIDPNIGQASTSALPPAQAKAFDWTFHETDLVPAAIRDVLGE
jgi:Fe-S-cluster containining protein